jgi:hypothetical protein
MAKGDKAPARQRISQSAEKELLPREHEARDDLAQLIEFVKGMAADAASDKRLTDKDREFFKRQLSIFRGSVAELIKALGDHQHTHVREYRLQKLFEALGSTCIIARNQLVDPIKNRLSTIAATKGRSVLTPKINEIIASEATGIRQRRSDFSDNEVARQIKDRVNERIAEAATEAGVKKIKLDQRAIGVRLKKMRSILS